jgi:hypothetical protein
MENKDVLGLAPYGEALKTVVEKSFEGLYGFLSTTFQPAVEEFGYMMKDKVRYWRLRNALKVMAKAKDRIEFDGKDFSELQALSGIENRSRLDRELDHLSSLSLLVGGAAATDGGFISTEKELSADITPSALALNLYCKTHSLNQNISEFWKKELVVKSTES